MSFTSVWPAVRFRSSRRKKPKPGENTGLVERSMKKGRFLDIVESVVAPSVSVVSLLISNTPPAFSRR